MFQISPVVKQLLIINVIFFVVAYVLLPQLQFLLPMYYPTSEHFQPFQIVTNLFMHADLNHLFFNMLALFFLGPMLEYKLGAKKFLALYLSAGVAGVIGHILMIFFGTIGLFSFRDIKAGLTQQPIKKSWHKEHYGGMIFSGTAAYTAFLVFGAYEYVSQLNQFWQALPWIGPTILTFIAMNYLKKRYKVKNEKTVIEKSL